MSTLATRLRNACLGVLLTNRPDDQLTDSEYALLGMVETWAQIEDSPKTVSDTIEKLRQYKLSRSNGTVEPDASERPQTPTDEGTRPVSEPQRPATPAAPLGGETTLDTRAPAGLTLGETALVLAPDTTEQAAELPLGAADRGPEPQDAGDVLDTSAPALANDAPDYTQLKHLTVAADKG